MNAARLSANYSSVLARRNKVQGIELLRGVLALVVVVFHFYYSGPILGDGVGAPAGHWLAYGFFAVSSFFVVSGYVISLSAQNRTALQFFALRFARLFPAIAVCATITFLVFLLFAEQQKTLIAWLNSGLLVPLLNGGPLIDKVYWTIVVELKFYFLIGLFLLFGLFPRALEIITATSLVLTAAYFLVGRVSIHWHLGFPHLPFFALGMILFRAGTEGRMSVYLIGLCILNFALAAFGAHLAFEASDWLDGARTEMPLGLLNGALVVFVAAGLVFLAQKAPVPQGLVPVTAFAGAVSYPLYLIHQDVGFVFMNALAEPLSPELARLLAVAAMLLLAYGVYRFVERPLSPRLRAGLFRALEKLPSVEGTQFNLGLRRGEVSPVPGSRIFTRKSEVRMQGALPRGKKE